MNEEKQEYLKHIFSDLQDHAKKEYVSPLELADIECEILLNYITNLQEENNLLKAKIKCMEESTEHNQKQPKDESEIYNEIFR